MAEERDRFVAGAVAQGYTEMMGTEIFDLIEPFAGYAFNKAHSVSYGLISYWTAYFKTHYALEYMASVLNCRLDHADRVRCVHQRMHAYGHHHRVARRERIRRALYHRQDGGQVGRPGPAARRFDGG